MLHYTLGRCEEINTVRALRSKSFNTRQAILCTAHRTMETVNWAPTAVCVHPWLLQPLPVGRQNELPFQRK